MTRQELHTELNKIEIFIDVLRDLVEKPICGCITHGDWFNEQFRKDNKEQLNALMEIRNFLKPLKIQSDEMLSKVVYQPVEVYR